MCVIQSIYMECVHICIKATRKLGLAVRMAKRIPFTASYTHFFFLCDVITHRMCVWVSFILCVYMWASLKLRTFFLPVRLIHKYYLVLDFFFTVNLCFFSQIFSSITTRIRDDCKNFSTLLKLWKVLNFKTMLMCFDILWFNLTKSIKLSRTKTKKSCIIKS